MFDKRSDVQKQFQLDVISVGGIGESGCLVETGYFAAMQGREHGELAREDELPPLRYEMRGMGHSPEDILFCVDVDAEVSMEMKMGSQGKGLSRLDAIKQALILFVHSKLMLHPQHKFAFATLRNSASWVRTKNLPA